MTCPKCGSLMVPKKDKKGRTVLVCRKCGYTLKNTHKKIRIGSKIKEEEKEVIVLEKKDSVLSIKEGLLRFDKKTDEPYVDVEVGEQEFERKDVKLGISDGVNVEILEGITMEDKIKVK